MNSVILDVDTGIDDALAIAYAVRSGINLIGITTCFGNVAVEDATRNSLVVLDYLNSNIPVISGADKPFMIDKKKQYPTHIHGSNGLGDIRLPETKKKKQEGHAVDFIIEQVTNHPNAVTLIMVGPLTNLALAIQKAPDITRNISRVIVMGGAVRVKGNVTQHAEANIYTDPEAADLVFRSNLPLTLVGLDVTMKTLLPLEELNVWREQGQKLSSFLADMTTFYIKAYESYNPGIGGCALHDPLAVGVAVLPDLVKQIPMNVQVDLQGETIGKTREFSNLTSNMNVCVDVDEESFLKHFLSKIKE